MRTLTPVVALAVMLTVTATAGAATFTFDPNDLIDLYDPGPPQGTPDPANPRVVDGYYCSDGYYDSYTGIVNWNSAGYGSALDQAVKSDYLQWRDQDGGYVAKFNSGNFNGSTGLHAWGQQVVMKPNTTLTATAAPGWAYHVEPVYDYTTWTDTGYRFIEWYAPSWLADTSNLDDVLRVGGPDIGEFSITGEFYVDLNQNGWDASDPAVQPGQLYPLYFGAWVVSDHWQSGTGTYGFSSTLDLQYGAAPPIPEPLTMAGLMLGVGSLIGYVRRRRRKER